MRNFSWFVVGVCLSFLFMAPSFAQTNYTGLDHINRIVRSTPGLTSIAVGQSTNAAIQATGPINFASASNLHMQIPVTVEATASRYAVAKAGAKIIARAVPFVGAALLAKEIYDLLKPEGIVQCSSDSYQPCQSIAPAPNQNYPAFPAAPTYWANGDGTYTKYLELPSVAHGCGGAYPAGFVGSGYRQTSASPCGFVMQGKISNVTLPPPTPTTEAAVDTALGNKIQDGSEAKKLYDMIAELIRGNPTIGTLGTDPLDIKAMPLKLVNTPPVTSPVTVTSTQKVTNPDGTTSTIVRKETTTVTPTMDPSATVGNPKLTFPSKTKVETTTTNDATGETKTDTDEQNADSPDVPPPLEIPTDYAREPTLQKVEQDLNSDAAPTMTPQGPIVTAAQTKSDTDLAAQRTSVQADQTGADKSKFFAWAWTAPIGTCSAAVGTVHGYAISWDYCPTVNNIRDVLGWLFAVLGLITIYGELFPRKA